jgi:glycosyltransferase involved in cell wall biosynthesis
VIVPAYRHERYVGQAIDSVLAQTISDWELILIDDASPDNTWLAAQAYSDSRVRCIRHDRNLGAHETINEGIRLAKGQYLAILNSDDIFFPQRLETCISLMEGQSLDLVGTDLVLITEDGRPVEDRGHWWLTWHQGLKDHYHENGDLLATLFTGNIFITTSNFFFRRTLPDKIGYFSKLRYVHDYDFCFRAIADPDVAVGFVPSSPTLAYRLHGDNTILQDRMAASRETFELLAVWYPRLVPPEQRPLALAFVEHARRVEGYIEEEFDLMIRSNVAHGERRSQACARQLAAKRSEIRFQQDQLLSLQQENRDLRYVFSAISSRRLEDADKLEQCQRETEQLRHVLTTAETLNATTDSATQTLTSLLCIRIPGSFSRIWQSLGSALRRLSRKTYNSMLPHDSEKPFREE